MTRIVTHWLVLFLIVLTSVAHAEIYRYQDGNGQIVYSDQATIGAEKLALPSQPYRYRYSVKRVIDGDTLELSDGQKVRLLSINTPEIASRFHNEQAGGQQAKTWLEQKLKQATVFLEYDSERQDHYQRSLAHCFLENGEYLNASLLEEGMAVLTVHPPNLRYVEQLQKAQAKAEKANRGIWEMPVYAVNKEISLSTDFEQIWQRWQLKPTMIKETRQYIHLVVSEQLRLSIAKQNLSLFPPLEQYLGKQLEVRGWLSRRKQQYTIYIQHPSALIPL